MPKGRSYSACTNRSGTKRRRVISTADSTASTDSTADRPETGSDQGERLSGGQQTGGNVQLLSDRFKDITNETVIFPEDGGRVGSGKEVVQPSPTNFDASRICVHQSSDRSSISKGSEKISQSEDMKHPYPCLLYTSPSPRDLP